MAGRLVVKVSTDIGDLDKDLDAIGDGLTQRLEDAFDYGSRLVADAARPLMRHGAASWPTSSAAHRYGSGPGVLAGYYDSTATTTFGAVIGRHPALVVWEWGGTIHPLLGKSLHRALSRSAARFSLRAQLTNRGQDRPPWTFHIPRLQPVQNAAAERRDEIAERLQTAVDELVDQYQLGG